jgi:hypothetical protein
MEQEPFPFFPRFIFVLRVHSPTTNAFCECSLSFSEKEKSVGEFSGCKSERRVAQGVD